MSCPAVCAAATADSEPARNRANTHWLKSFFILRPSVSGWLRNRELQDGWLYEQLTLGRSQAESIRVRLNFPAFINLSIHEELEQGSVDLAIFDCLMKNSERVV